MKYYTTKPKGYFENIRVEMLDFLPKNALRVLDVGCGNGSFAAEVKKKLNAEVWGIEYVDSEANAASKVLDKVYSGACENFIEELPNGYFDAIYFNDVLEHLADPYSVLNTIKSKLSPNGVVISSIPNVRYYKTFLKVILQKDWKYEEYGTMDKTHLRFFTGKSIVRMYDELGFKIEKHVPINKTKSLKPILLNLFLLFTQMDIRVLQYATVASVEKQTL
jgi:2-polyprenyl-3-methyl-5-hydroxy-6-metoxy-1,4-benzoquinol methylase